LTMPRRDDLKTENEAMAIVRAEEIANGWTPSPPFSKRREREEGCDFLSYPPDGGEPHAVEVKGWGGSVFLPDGRFRTRQDLNADQLARAQRDPNWRLEIVANLGAARTGSGSVERMSLTAEEVCRAAEPWKYRIDLDGLVDRVRTVQAVEPRSGRNANMDDTRFHYFRGQLIVGEEGVPDGKLLSETTRRVLGRDLDDEAWAELLAADDFVKGRFQDDDRDSVRARIDEVLDIDPGVRAAATAALDAEMEKRGKSVRWEN
jgi:hypothetical protein